MTKVLLPAPDAFIPNAIDYFLKAMNRTVEGVTVEPFDIDIVKLPDPLFMLRKELSVAKLLTKAATPTLA
tara:strand:- start:149 stop:358 length:210 start_codon:yes stop_codon:yes gene_type:complete